MQTASVPYTYEYPRPAVTVDAVLGTAGPRGDLRILLIQRKFDPFQESWALPGGFVDEHEDLAVAARREMLEETGVDLERILQLGAYGTPHRDPRGHTVGVAFLAMCAPDELVFEAGDDAQDCRWFSAKRPPRLAFDHKDIVRDARRAFARIAARRTEFVETFFGPRRARAIGNTGLAALRRAARDA
ncbi:MAG: NUDIX hydrolase [Planctomycetes bacterium]|nr:NUDIX hydrolase [Planctomycetota bacterium]